MLSLFGATKVTESQSTRTPIIVTSMKSAWLCMHVLHIQSRRISLIFSQGADGASHPFSFWKTKDKSSPLGIGHRAGICFSTGTEPERKRSNSWLIKLSYTFIHSSIAVLELGQGHEASTMP